MKTGHFARNGFLTERGYAEFAQRSLEGLEVCEVGLTRSEECVRLDKSGSVSALVEGEGFVFDDQLLENQYQRFLDDVA